MDDIVLFFKNPPARVEFGIIEMAYVFKVFEAHLPKT